MARETMMAIATNRLPSTTNTPSSSSSSYYYYYYYYQIYIPPSGQLSLNGFVSTSNFYRGVLDNIGIEPQVVRIGDYK